MNLEHLQAPRGHVGDALTDGLIGGVGYTMGVAAKAEDLDVPPPPDYEPERISADDYFLKNHEFSAWLKSSQGKVSVAASRPCVVNAKCLHNQPLRRPGKTFSALTTKGVLRLSPRLHSTLSLQALASARNHRKPVVRRSHTPVFVNGGFAVCSAVRGCSQS